MTVRDFIEAITEGSDVVYRLFDCRTTDLISIETDDGVYEKAFNRDDLLFTDYADYEVGGVDVWIGPDGIYMEFNIEVEEE